MPWPPRLQPSLPLLPLLTVVILLSTAPPPHASALSYAEGQPEYPSQPEVTSDRDALARVFLQGLLEKEGKSKILHGFSSGDDSETWNGSPRNLKRTDGIILSGQSNIIPIQDVNPKLLHEAYDDVGGMDSGYEDLEPLIEKEKMMSEMLSRAHPHSGHRISSRMAFLSEDPAEENMILRELLRIIMRDEGIPNNVFRDYEDRHRFRPVSGGEDGREEQVGGLRRFPVTKRDPFGINARGFHDDVFNRDFGSFNPMKRVARDVNKDSNEDGEEQKEREKDANKSRNEAKINGLNVSGGMDVPKRTKRSTEERNESKLILKPGKVTPTDPKEEVSATQKPLSREERSTWEDTAVDEQTSQQTKRRPEMDSSGFHGDTFNSGFGDFWTMKRNVHYLHPYGLAVVGKRRPEMDSSGFHGDTFNSGFGDFWTMKRMVDGVNPPNNWPSKRRPEMDSSGFHGDTFSSGFGDFYTMKRSPGETWFDKEKRRPEMDSSGFHGDTFNGGFGDFWTMKRNAQAHPFSLFGKRRPEMDSSGFHGDTFNSGFGDFWTMKRNDMSSPGNYGKRRPEMDSSGFHGDTFNGGFGDFWTMKRDVLPGSMNVLTGSKIGPGWRGEYDGGKSTFGKRRPEMDSSGFHGDTFNGGFGDFWTMKRGQMTNNPRMKREVVREKRRPEMDASGFHGDTFSNGFGDFWTLKRSGTGEAPSSRWTLGKLESKRRPEMDSSGFHGDTFNSGFGDFWTMKRNNYLSPYPRYRNVKRRPEMDSSGFHGDTFNGGFGDFWTMKRGYGYTNSLPDHLTFLQPNKRRPEMDSSGFHGDTFNGGFGDFWTMKRGVNERERDNSMEKQVNIQRENKEEARNMHDLRKPTSTDNILAVQNVKDSSEDGLEDKDKARVDGNGKIEGNSDTIKN